MKFEMHVQTKLYRYALAVHKSQIHTPTMIHTHAWPTPKEVSIYCFDLLSHSLPINLPIEPWTLTVDCSLPPFYKSCASPSSTITQ